MSLLSKKKIARSLVYLPIFFLTLSSCSVFVNPASFPISALFYTSFPIWLVLSLLAALFLCRYKKSLLIYACGLLINGLSIYNFCPVNIQETPNDYQLKIVSYNVHNFRKDKDLDTTYLKQFVPVFNDFQADLIFYQEGGQGSLLKDALATNYPYQLNTMTEKSSNLGVYSKYPILNYEIIVITRNNATAIFNIQLPTGDTLSVLNCHLVSYNFEDDHFSLTKFLNASRLRGEQVDSICKYLDKHDTSNMIVLGDFNETPISYSHHKFSSRLKDCFVSSGMGFGATFNKFFSPLRIDHIFCGEGWASLTCCVNKDYELSDHFPIVATLRKN